MYFWDTTPEDLEALAAAIGKTLRFSDPPTADNPHRDWRFGSLNVRGVSILTPNRGQFHRHLRFWFEVHHFFVILDPLMKDLPIAQLPDVLRMDDGSRVSSVEDWPRRRLEIIRHLEETVFGPLPTPVEHRVIPMCCHRIRHLDGIRHELLRVSCQTEPRTEFPLDLFLPPGDGPFPVIVDGDGCWRYATDEVLTMLTGRGYALALFNRTAIVPDHRDHFREGPLFEAHPNAEFGALAAWCWGYQRTVDVLLKDSRIDPQRIGCVGHSRGGKTSLLAGATDERISLVSANGSGCGGAGCLRFMNREAETIAAITRTFPFWFRSSFADFAGREEDLPVDLHDLKALVAPRPLLVTYGYDDNWANLAGSLLTHEATLPAYALHGAEDLCTLHFREGAHYHGIEDWTRLVDFADHHWFGKSTPGHVPLDEPSKRLKQEPLIDPDGQAYAWQSSA